MVRSTVGPPAVMKTSGPLITRVWAQENRFPTTRILYFFEI